MKTARPYTRSATSNGSRTHNAIPLPCLPIDFCAEQSRLKRVNGWGLRLCYGRSFAIHTRSRCGLVRGCPVLSSQFSPGAAPQVGHRTPSTCFGLSSFVTQTSTYKRVGNWTSSGKPVWTVYALLTTDIGRLCRKALMSALFICKPPL
jgi:hypothetical protein